MPATFGSGLKKTKADGSYFLIVWGKRSMAMAPLYLSVVDREVSQLTQPHKDLTVVDREVSQLTQHP